MSAWHESIISSVVIVIVVIVVVVIIIVGSSAITGTRVGLSPGQVGFGTPLTHPTQGEGQLCLTLTCPQTWKGQP
jgi:hypothetical protein